MGSDSDGGVPVLFTHVCECCGCTACVAICTQAAISMCPDDEGFDYPVIDPAKCTRCLLCIRVCPMGIERAGS
jgi:ferredoxin